MANQLEDKEERFHSEMVKRSRHTKEGRNGKYKDNKVQGQRLEAPVISFCPKLIKGKEDFKLVTCKQHHQEQVDGYDTGSGTVLL